MPNPYEAPSKPLHNNSQARQRVHGPATALMVVSMIAIVIGILGLAIDAVLVLSGTTDRLEAINDGPMSKHTQIMVRTVWGIILLIASSFVFYGALQMKNVKNYGTARAAAVIAMVPLVGPCCLLGIPFGIWAFSVLGDPNVKNAFR